MATTQLTSAASSVSVKGFASFDLRVSKVAKLSSFSFMKQNRSFHSVVVKAAAAIAPAIAPKYTSLKPLGDRVLLKINVAEEKTSGGIILPTSAQPKPQGGEVVAVGEGRAVGKNNVEISVEAGSQVVYSKYAGTEVDFNGSSHLILKEDDIIGILETDDIKDLKPLGDRVLVKVAEVEEKTAGGLLLSSASREKPSVGTVIAVGPGPLDEEGKRKPLSVSPGNTVLYSKYAGNDFKSADGTQYIVLRVSDVIAIYT